RKLGAPPLEPSAGSHEALETPSAGASVRDSVTRTGAVIGTPAYMAPEQHLGRELDGRADQFSYCVALWEALQGERPFRATHPVELMIETTRGEIAIPKDSTIPPWLRAVLLRGLANEPAKRFASMDALLLALADDPARTRRRIAIAVGAGALAIAGVGYYASTREDPCAGGDRELAEVWAPARKAELARAFVDTALPYAADVAAGTTRRLDAYAAAWLDARTDACTATHVRGEHSEQTLAKRMRCIERRRRDLGALVDVLVQADAATVERASDSLQALRSLDACSDPALGWGDVPVPEDPEARASVDALRDELARVVAFDRAARWREGVELAESAAEQARRIGDAALRAEAELAYAHVLVGAGRPEDGVAHLHDAATSAMLAGHDQALLDAWISLVWHTGVDLSRPEDAASWARYADAVLERSGRPRRELGNLRAAQAAVAWAHGDAEQSLVYARESLAVRSEDQPGDPILANTELQIGSALISLARYDEADAPLQHALAIAIEVDGPAHPLVGAIENTIGVRHFLAGHWAEAETHWHRAFAITEGALGPDHLDLFYSLGNLAEAMREQGKYGEALAALARVEQLQAQSLPANHREIGTTHHNIAMVLLDQGDTAAALDRFRDAVRVRAAAADDPALANSLTGLGEALLARDRPAEALVELERAQAIRDENPGEPIAAARTRLALGRARWIEDRDRAAAHALVRAAAAELAALRGPSRDRLVATAAAWLADHTQP
ncbi:MAG TPA: tetratricopeptide repeat-containing protein kinase family protein, partial [Nannocystaceae bacterium]|nr:tetratricopeptide repeat-containing protein kinase family protein [Nannocystaceae bacterium]